MEKKLLTKKELAEYFGVSIATVDRDMKKGLPYLKMSKFVRFYLDEVLEFYKKNKES